MSGGTWDYRDKTLAFLAEDVREGVGRSCDPEGNERLPTPLARTYLADVMMVVVDLLRELDYAFAYDADPIDDERAWIAQARRQLAAIPEPECAS